MNETTTSRREERYEFGKNWQKYLACIDEERIEEAASSLKRMLHLENLENHTFLDAGSGSGLFSLAARKLGASVRSFDYDPDSVAATAELKKRYFPGDPHWMVERGSVLDRGYLASLGRYDVVYSWGVLHHTSDMWRAFRNVATLVADNGWLYISIYNYQPLMSSVWRTIKRLYNRSPHFLRTIMNVSYYLFLASTQFGFDWLRGRNPLDRHRGKGRRGMSMYRDVADWLGGYPFEVATPDEVCRFYGGLGFTRVELKTVGRKSGCNEFVFKKASH